MSTAADPVASDRGRGIASALAERAISKLVPLLQTSPALADATAVARFARLVADREALQPHAWNDLASAAGLSPLQVDEVRITLELGRLAQGDCTVVSALQAQRANGRIRQLIDMVQWSESDWQSLRGQVLNATAPKSQLAVEGMQKRLREMFPMAFLEKAAAKQADIDWQAIRELLAGNTTMDPLSRTPKSSDLEHLDLAYRPAVQEALAALRREVRAYPDFDWRAAVPSQDHGSSINPIRRGVARFIAQAPGFDMQRQRVVDFVAEHPEALQGVEPSGHVVVQLQRMQRVYRVAPNADATHALLGEGLHSAFAISRVPADTFVSRLGPSLGGDESAATIHAAARGVAAAASSIAWTARLRGAGPLPAAVGTWPPPELQVPSKQLRDLLQPQVAATRQVLVDKPSRGGA